MQQLFEFLNDCKAQIRTSVLCALKKDAPTPKRKRVDDLIDLFTTGYNAALETDPESLSKNLAGVPYLQKSVMLEGSYAAVASLDLKAGSNWTKLQELLSLESENIVSINEGIGHALCLQRESINFDPAVTTSFWGFLAMDGYGCHAGYFRWPSVIGKQEVPAGMDAAGMHAFDQGLGRSLWLIGAADPKTMASAIDRFPPSRRAALWSGVGMMIGFWGADDDTDMRRLRSLAGRWHAWLKLGIAWSAYARLKAEDVTDFTEGACDIICRSSVAEVASITISSLEAVSGDEQNAETYRQWKLLMAKEFSNN